MYDHNVSSHWREDEPAWVKSLTSSLDRRDGASSTLPLTLIVEEIVNWAELAGGTEAWVYKRNRESLLADLDQAVLAVGPNLDGVIETALKTFSAAFAHLIVHKNPAHAEPPGARTNPTWAAMLTAAKVLLDLLDSDRAVGASWDDLVATAQDRTLDNRQYGPIADLLFAQLGRRGLDATRLFRSLVDMVAYGRSPDDHPLVTNDIPAEDRVAAARVIATAPAELHDVVVWLGFDGRVTTQLDAGNVTFHEAQWAVPNATPDGQAFPHKEELAHLLEHGHLFKVAEKVGQKSDCETLVRVNLGKTHTAGAPDRALEIVETILNVSIHYGGGVRPHLTQYGVLADDEYRASSHMTSRRATGFPDDHYGASLTSEAVHEHGPKIAEALAKQRLPKFLAAALEVQTTAEYPFSRDLALRKPSQADISSVIPLSDRVVQHIAAYAAISPDIAFETLGAHWAHASWIWAVQDAVHLCLASGDRSDELREELMRDVYDPTRGGLLMVAERAADFLSVCLVEHERAWIQRVFSSLSDQAIYLEFISEFEAEREVLESRRRRVRNALVHGSPAHFDVVSSVRTYSEFLSNAALAAGMESYVMASNAVDELQARSPMARAMDSGMDCASYLRSQKPPAKSS